MATFRHLPTLAQLRHLIALSEHEHFGRAAESCFITQSSISTSIKELELTLGQRLVERTKRKVMMSPLGLDVVNRARQVIRDVEDICDLVNAAQTPLSGAIRLGVIPSIAPFLLPRVLPALRHTYPSLKLYLREAQTAPLLRQLGDGELDLLLIAFPYPVADFESHIFAEDSFWVAFPEGHSLEKKEHLSFRDLKNEELMLLEEGHCLRQHALEAVGATDHRTPGDFQASSLHTLVQMVDNGLGLTLLPKMAVDTGITNSTRVKVRPLEGKHTSRQIGLVWRRTSARKLEYERLADFFRDELATPLNPKSDKR